MVEKNCCLVGLARILAPVNLIVPLSTLSLDLASSLAMGISFETISEMKDVA